jgi:hypothetical protein
VEEFLLSHTEKQEFWKPPSLCSYWDLPHAERIFICYPSSARVSLPYGFYGSPESLMHGRDFCHICQLARGPCFLTTFLPTLFQRAGSDSYFIQPYLRVHSLNTIILNTGKEIYIAFSQ